MKNSLGFSYISCYYNNRFNKDLYFTSQRSSKLKKRKLFSVLASTAILLSFHSTTTPSVGASSQKLNDLQNQKQELNRQSGEISGEIGDREQKMQSLESERQQLSADIENIQINIDTVLTEIREQEEEIARLEEEIEKLNNEIQILQDNIEIRNQALAEQARTVQRKGAPTNVIDIVLSAESLTELVGKMEVINLLVNNNNSLMEDQIRDKEAVESKAAEVDLAREETEEVKVALEVSRNNLVAQRMELDNKLQIVAANYDLTSAERAALESQRSEIAAKTSEIDQQVQQEQARIVAEEKARREREEAARRQAEAEARERAQVAAAEAAKKASSKKQQSVQASSSTPAPAPSPAPTPAPAPSNTGGWVRPASGGVTSEFGYRIHPVHGTTRLHAGIDIGGGGAIRAAKAGTVTRASFSPTLGYFVEIDHGGGISTAYGHMTPGLQVAPGQSVSAGQTLGTMGTTGTSTGVHLHFEVRVNGAAVNPRGYVSF